MLVPDPVRPKEVRVKILDFGIAKLAAKGRPGQRADGSVLRSGDKTEAGAHLGTPLYMAPEQHGHAEEVDDRADVFSLGIVLYELLAGKLPYKTNAMAFIAEPAVPLSQIRKDLPTELSQLVQKMVAFEPAARPQMPEVAKVLAALVRKSRRRVSPVLTAVAGAAFVVVSAVVAFSVWQLVRVPTLAEARDRALKQIKAGLSAQDPSERRLALRAIELSHDPNHAALLPPLLTDEQALVAGAAAGTLGELGAVEFQGELLSALEKSGQAQTRLQIAAALAKLSHPRGTQTLHATLEHGDATIRVETALKLAELGDTKAFETLRRATEGETKKEMLPLLLALANNGDAQAVGKLKKWFETKMSAAEKTRLAFELSRLGDVDAQKWLSQTAQTEGPEQLRAGRYLVLLGDSSHSQQFEKHSIDDQQPDAVRTVAVEGLSDCGRAEHARQLAQVLRERHIGNQLRYTTAGAILLLAAGNQLAQQDLSLRFAEAALKSQDEGTRELAVMWLSRTQAGTASLGQAMTDGSAVVRQRAAEALGKEASRSAVDALVTGLSDRNKEVRIESALALLRAGAALQKKAGPEAVQPVLEKLRKLRTDGDERERAAAAAALAALGDKNEEAVLRAAATSADAKVRRLAVEHGALDQATLRQALSDSDVKVRFSAAKKLAQRGDKTAVPVLRAVAASSDLDAVTAYGLLSQLGEETEPPPTMVIAGASLAERLRLLSVIETLPPAAAKKLVAVLAQDADPVVRHKAAEVSQKLFAQTRDGWFLRPLRALAVDSDARVRVFARRLLEETQRASAAGPQLTDPTVGKPVSRPDGPEKSAPPDKKDTPKTPDGKDGKDGKDGPDVSQVGQALLVGETGIRVQIDKGDWQLLPEKPVSLSAGKHRVAFAGGSQIFDIKAGETTTVRVAGSVVEQLVLEALEALRKKEINRAQQLIDKARRVALRMATRPQVLSEVTFAQAKVFDEKGLWREAMTEYQRYLALPAQHKRAETLGAVKAAVAKLLPRMGRVQVFTVRNGKCKLTDEYYLPPGEHLISLGEGRSKTLSIYAGATSTVKQCP